MSLAQITGSYLNPYEKLNQLSANNPYYSQEAWKQEARKGNIDVYINAMSKIGTYDQTKLGDFTKTLQSGYNYDFADTENKTAALYNELYANRNNTDEKRKRLLYNPNGTPKIGSDGKQEEETYEASDYEYYKSIIKSNADINYQKYLADQEQARKDSLSPWIKTGATIVGTVGEFVGGVANTVDNLISGLGSLVKATSDALNGTKRFDDSLVESLGKDSYRLLQGLEDGILDFERKYSYLRDINGNYTDLGKILGGVSYSLGQMVPAMLIQLIPGIGQVAGGALAEGLSTGVFYSSMTFGQIRETYKQFAYEGITMPTYTIMLNSSLKATFQWAVEKGLGKLIGGSALDNMMYGEAVKMTEVGLGAGTKGLTEAGVKRLIHDFFKEGLEEAFQDTSDFFVDVGFEFVTGENYGSLDNFTIQNLTDSFIIGGLASFAGSALKIVGNDFRRKYADVRIPQIDKEGNLIKDKDGNYQYKSLKGIAAWEYGLSMQSFFENFNELRKLGLQLNKMYDINKWTKDTPVIKQFQEAYTQMYTAYRMIASIYNDIGEERFNAANAILDKVTVGINAGKFYSQDVVDAVDAMMNNFKAWPITRSKMIKEQLAKAKMTEVKAAAKNAEEAENNIADKEIVDKLTKIFEDSEKPEVQQSVDTPSKINHIIVTKDGSDIVVDEETGTVYASEGEIKVGDEKQIFQHIAEKFFVQKIIEKKFTGIDLDTILTEYKRFVNNDNVTLEEAIRAIVYDVKFFNYMLYTANKDMYQFMQSIHDIESVIVPADLRTSEYKNTLRKTLKNMKKCILNYVISNQFVDLDILPSSFTKEDIDLIQNKRYLFDLTNDAILDSKQITKEDWAYFKDKIDNCPTYNEDEKKYAYDTLLNETPLEKMHIIGQLNNVYKNLFFSKYDNKTYLIENTKTETIFNKLFLQANGITLETIYDERYLTDTDKNAITTQFGSIDAESIMIYRKQQYEAITNNKYTFETYGDEELQFVIFEKETNIIDGTSYIDYYSEQTSLYNKDNINTFAGYFEQGNFKIATGLTSPKKIDALKSLIVSDKINKDIVKYMTINDILNNPEVFLDEAIKEDILTVYGEINPITAFNVLNAIITEGNSSLALVVNTSGRIQLANVEAMNNLLKSDVTKLKAKTKASEIIDSKYLVGNLKNLIIQLNPNLSGANGIYNSTTNSIELKNNIDTAYGKAVLLHEIEHAIQRGNNFIGGTNDTNLGRFSSTTKQRIINDIKKHMPALFEYTTVEDGQEIEITDEERVNEFLYYATGEYMAYGFTANHIAKDILDELPDITFYPVIAANDRLVMPWGSTYYYDGKVHIYAQNNINILKSLDPDYNICVDSLTHQTVQVSKDSFVQSILSAEETEIDSIFKRGYVIDTNGEIRQSPNFNILLIEDEISNLKLKNDNNYQQHLVNISSNKNIITITIESNILTEKTYNTLKTLLNDLKTISGIIEINDLKLNEFSTIDECLMTAADIAKDYQEPTSINFGTPDLGWEATETKDKIIAPTKTRGRKKLSIEELAAKKSAKSKATAKTRFREASTRKYIGQKEYAGTNIEKYGYTKKYASKYMDTRLVEFIVRADKNIDSELWDKLTQGTLELTDISTYIRIATDIDQHTFNLINDCFYHNEAIKSFEELEKYAGKSEQYFALDNVIFKHILKDNPILAAQWKQSAGTATFDAILQTVESNDKLKKIYDKYLLSYDGVKIGENIIPLKIKRTSSASEGQDIILDTGKLRESWLKYFDGSLFSGGRAASIARLVALQDFAIGGKYNPSKLISLQSTKETKDGSVVLADAIADNSTPAIEGLSERIARLSRADRETVLKTNLPVILYNQVQKDKSINPSDYYKVVVKRMSEINYKIEKGDLTKAEFDKLYDDLMSTVTEKERLEMLAKCELIDQNYSQLENPLVTAIATKVSERNSRTVMNSIYAMVSKIKRAMTSAASGKLLKSKVDRLLQDNSDIFDVKLQLEPEVYSVPSTTKKNTLVYRDLDKLLELESRIQQIWQAIKEERYNSDRALKAFKNSIARSEKAIKDVEAVEAQTKTTRPTKTYTINIYGNAITIDSNKEIPPMLDRILKSDFTYNARSKTKYYTNDNEAHITANYKKFMEVNAELLSALTQADVDEILNFYANSEINLSSGQAIQYAAAEIWLLTYIDSPFIAHNFALTDEQHTLIKNKIEPLMSLAGAIPDIWHSGMKNLKPQEVLEKALSVSCGLEFTTESIQELSHAVLVASNTRGKSNEQISLDYANLQKVRENIYTRELERYSGRKRTFLEKLLKYEQLAMLSGPGTWVRNVISNYTVRELNKGAEGIAGLLEKWFPQGIQWKWKGKKVGIEWLHDGQYHIIGTQVTEEVKNFVNTQIISNNLLGLIFENTSKYDTRKYDEKSDVDRFENLGNMIKQSIKSQIFREGEFIVKDKDGKLITKDKTKKIYEFIYARLSDDKFVNKRFYYYVGKILTELKAQNKIELDKGLTNEVLQVIVDSYTMAAADYMHRPNFIASIESSLKERLGDKAYFMYKQIFPFMSASWNWFIEGLNYTPFGLAKAIINLAKFENTVERMENAQYIAKLKGDKAPYISSKFAEYINRRNIGKGIIGSIGMLIGMGLAALGFARIDDEDDQIKLKIGNVYIDISDLFGTQGIFAGMTIVGTIKHAYEGKEDANWMDAFMNAMADTLENMFIDDSIASLYNTMRGLMSGRADRLLYLPDKMLQMMIPNFLKTLSQSTYVYKVRYSTNPFLKMLQKVVANIPGVVYTLPKYVDIYSGEEQIMTQSAFTQILSNTANKLLPITLYPYSVSANEKRALELGVVKKELSGNYEINDEKVKLNTIEKTNLNKLYGQLNKASLDKLFNNEEKYRVLNEKGKYETLYYSEMTEKEKATIIDRLMSNNSDYCKIYYLTSTGKYKYYASDDKYKELVDLGITENVYRATSSLKGFIK